MLYYWIGRTHTRKTRNNQKPFPLPGKGEKGEGGRKHSFHWKTSRSRFQKGNNAWKNFCPPKIQIVAASAM